MQNHIVNSKSFQPKYHYDLPLKLPQPQTRRSSFTNISVPGNTNVPVSDKIISSHLKVLEPEEYFSLELTLQTKFKNLQDNAKVCKQKSKIKDREMQALAQVIGKLSLKTLSEQQKLKKRERQLQKISVKCQQLASNISNDQDKINKQAVYLHEQTNKYTSFQEMILSLEEGIRQAQFELERKKQLCSSLESLEHENHNLKEHYSQLQNEEKLIQYRESHDRSECAEMEKKIEQLSKVLKERNRINKNNQNKLSKIAKEVQILEVGLRHKEIHQNQIKGLELEIGDFNQDLLLVNDQISEFQFKIKRKQQNIEELRAKLFRVKEQTPLPVQSGQKERQNQQLTSKELPQKRSGPGNRPNNGCKAGQQAHQTPTFPSNISNELYFNSEPPRGFPREEGSHSKETNIDLQNLIKRYEQIVSKDKVE